MTVPSPPGSGRFAVKVYGERNTGTKYLEQLMVRNFDVDLLPGAVPAWLAATVLRAEAGRDLFFRLTERRNLGWKHSVPDRSAIVRETGRTGRRLLVATIAKNPYSWLLSLHRRPYHGARDTASFERFLVEPWVTVRREHAPEHYASPVHLWNAKNAAYASLGSLATHYRFEDVLADPIATLEALETREGLPRRAAELRNVTESTSAGGRRTPAATYDDYRAYYLEERWRERLPHAAIAIIDERLDRDLVAHLGYELLSR